MTNWLTPLHKLQCNQCWPINGFLENYCAKWVWRFECIKEYLSWDKAATTNLIMFYWFKSQFVLFRALVFINDPLELKLHLFITLAISFKSPYLLVHPRRRKQFTSREEKLPEPCMKTWRRMSEKLSTSFVIFWRNQNNFSMVFETCPNMATNSGRHILVGHLTFIQNCGSSSSNTDQY